jgi:hypothetical protein
VKSTQSLASAVGSREASGSSMPEIWRGATRKPQAASGRFAMCARWPRIARSFARASGSDCVSSTLSAPGYDAGHVYLIRPDAHVALGTPVDDPRALIAALEHIAAG